MSNRPPDPAAIIAAVRHGLCPRGEPVALEIDDAVTASHAVRYDSLSGFLAVAALDGAVVIDDAEFLASLMDQWQRQLSGCVVLEALIVRTAAVLDGAGVTWRLTKGAALAHLDYPNPAVRTFGDMDVVIHPDQWTTALDALMAAGYQRGGDVLGGDYDRRYGKGVTLATPEGLEVDLHRRFAIGRFGVTSRMDEIFEPHDMILLGGVDIPVLGATARLLHACYHASLGGYRYLRALRDVAQLILVTGADWEEAFVLARGWKAEAVVASAIIESWQRLQLDAGHPAHQRALVTAVSRGDQRALQVFRDERPFRAKALTAVGALPITEVPRYLWCLASHRRGS